MGHGTYVCQNPEFHHEGVRLLSSQSEKEGDHLRDHNIFEQLRNKYADEDRAKLLMLQLRTIMEQKKKKKWYHKFTTQTKTKPKSWLDD